MQLLQFFEHLKYKNICCVSVQDSRDCFVHKIVAFCLFLTD